MLVATAHPAKFNDVVEPLIGADGAGAARAGRVAGVAVAAAATIAPTLEALRAVLMGRSLENVPWTAGLALGRLRRSAAVGAAALLHPSSRCGLIRARRAIDNVISSVAYDELRNVLLPTGSGDQIHVNYLLLTQKGLLLIDLFDTHGMIFAGEKMGQWSIFGPKRHFMIANPLPMLYDRVAAVRQFAGDDVPVEGRIVFSMRGEFPKGRPDAVIRLDELQDQYPGRREVAGRRRGRVRRRLGPHQRPRQPNPLAR